MLEDTESAVRGPEHPLSLRILAEELVRRRRPDEGRRAAVVQRWGRIDPNPHQIEAVAFALRRLRDGGCILADEVGLGKTIEAGLVIAQLLSEGARRILLVVPKSLLGQWRAELYDLFGLETREAKADPETLRGVGVFLVHRELAGGERGAPVLWGSDPFDLVVIDEAHEVFSAIYKRFSVKDGTYDESSKHALIAHRVRDLLLRHRAPVLLLTATPIQNSLLELWGLVQYVEPNATLLGDLPTFRELFCSDGDRRVASDEAGELKRRLGAVVQRTLRRQAQEFLAVPFVERRARLVEYSMSPDERSLYDDVTDWLLRPDLLAFGPRNNRALVLLGFHRRMASSLPALSASLRRLAHRLRRVLGLSATASSPERDVLEDLEDDEAQGVDPEAEVPPSEREKLQAELSAIEGFARRADGLGRDSKAEALVEHLRALRGRPGAEEGSGKVVIFTESLTTQEHLRDRLIEEGWGAESITLFRGTNDSSRARAARERWLAEIGPTLPVDQRPSPEVAMRLALVHEFRVRSSVFIGTEAAAKGLNLQFAETVVNYDLPWNPQRIEQRIGRVHRYGQRRPVTVINFVARDNEAERLTFEILSEKLELFGRVLDASDVVLHDAEAGAESLVSVLGSGLEADLRTIYEECRSRAEVFARLRALKVDLEERKRAFLDEHTRTRALIESRLDEVVRRVFRGHHERMEVELDRLDRDLERLVSSFLEARGVPFGRRPTARGVEIDLTGSEVLGGVLPAGVHQLRLGSPLVELALRDVRERTVEPAPVAWVPPPGGWPADVRPLEGRRGRLAVAKVSYAGFEPVEHLVMAAVLDGGGEEVPEAALRVLLEAEARVGDEGAAVDPARLEMALAARLLTDQAKVGDREATELSRRSRQLDAYLDDQLLVWRRRAAALEERREKLERQGEASAVAKERKAQELAGVERELDRINARIGALATREDPSYQRWRDDLEERRYTRPMTERLFEVDFSIGEGLIS